jgi:putative hemolysin
MSTLLVTLLMSLAVGTLTAAATAVRSANRMWLRHWAERQIAGEAELVAVPLDRPRDYLLAAGTGIAAIVFALGAILAFRESGLDVIRHLVTAAVALLLFGQVVPRAIARHRAGALLSGLAPLLRALHLLLGPILAFAARLVRRVAPGPSSTGDTDTGDPLVDLLRDAEAEGIGAAAESEIISGVAEFSEKRVRDVMTPRERVVAVRAAAAPTDVVQTVIRSNYTRIPVLSGADERVVGVLHAFDVLADPGNPLATLRKAEVAAPEEPCGAVMRRMLRDHRHLGVVLDGGRLIGIVTLEDLVEELVGDIHDEHDEPGVPA